MNKTTIGVLAVVILLLGASFYLFSVTMPFGMDSNEMNSASDIGEHSHKLQTYEISPGETVKKIQANDGVVLLDVRTPKEYKEIHLKGALLLPVQELSQKSLNEIGLGTEAKDKEIILYCRSGSRSKTAYDIMKSLGYTNLKMVSGGMIHWEEDKYPFTETGSYKDPVVQNNLTSSSTTATGPHIMLKQTFYDFGKITQYGGTVTKDFSVTNDGTETLEIGDITTSCSCTSATISNTSIEPGQTAKLNVVFDPDFHAEPLDVFKRTVFIPTNDPNTPEAEVSIQVDILEGE